MKTSKLILFWGGETRKFICPDEVVRIFRARMGGDEIPAGGGSGGFLFEARRKMFLQVNIVFSTPLYAPL